MHIPRVLPARTLAEFRIDRASVGPSWRHSHGALDTKVVHAELTPETGLTLVISLATSVAVVAVLLPGDIPENQITLVCFPRFGATGI